MRKQGAVIGNNYYWTKKNNGFIDTRPGMMSAFRSSFDNIRDHNSVFIIFADSRSSLETVYATKTGSGFETLVSNIDNWSFLSVFDRKIFNASYTEGREIFVTEGESSFYKFLEKNITDAHYTCTLEPLRGYSVYSNYYTNSDFHTWVSTATDKYGNAVAGVFKPTNRSKGWVFIFPQIKYKPPFLLEFLRDILPELAPELFPYSETHTWINRDEYLSSPIISLKKEIAKIEEESKNKIEVIEERIRNEKEATDYANKLITETDTSLVKAVEKTFEVLGFKKIINLDEEYEKSGNTSGNDEDLQILDEPVSILTEVKGIIGLPKDDDSLQVLKHVPIA